MTKLEEKLIELGINICDYQESLRIMENIKTQAKKWDQVVNQMKEDLEILKGVENEKEN